MSFNLPLINIIEVSIDNYYISLTYLSLVFFSEWHAIVKSILQNQRAHSTLQHLLFDVEYDFLNSK